MRPWGTILSVIEPTPPKSSSATAVVIVVIVLVVICAGAVPVVGILAAIAIPHFVEMQHRTKRMEVPANIAGIKAAELAYNANYNRFVPQDESVPVPEWELGRELVPWRFGTNFDTLGWEPGGLVRGTYWVEITDGGRDFTVHGMCDVDGDGVPAHYTATKTTNAVQITSRYIY